VGESDGGSLSTLCPLLGYSRQAYYQRRCSVEKEIFEGLLRGLQYHSAEYLRLWGPRTSISMSENSDPLENAIAERVNGILKDELLEARFDSFAEAQSEIAMALSTYNHLRPHSSVEILTPATAHTRTGELKRRWKSYYRPKTTQEASNAAI